MVPKPIPPLLWGALWALPTAALAAAALPVAAALALAGAFAALRSRHPAARAGLLALPALLVAATPPSLPPPNLPTGPVRLSGPVLEVVRTPALGLLMLRIGDGGRSLRVACDGDFEVLPGDHVRLLARIGEPPAPDTPPSIHARARSVLVQPGPTTPARLAAAARRSCERSLLEQLPPDVGPMVATLVLGRGTRPPGDLLQAHQATGLSHLLAVSGAHAAMLAAIVGLTGRAQQRRLGTHPRRTTVLLLLLAVYAAMTGNEPPVLRALISCLLVALGAWLGRPCGIATSLLAPAMFTCLVRPDALLGPSFLLSYAAVAGLSLVAPGSRERGARHWLWRALVSSAWATLTTAPLTLIFFGQLAPWTVLLTPLLAPLVGALLLGGLALALLAQVTPWLAPLVAWPLGHVAQFYAAFVQVADQLPATPVHALLAPPTVALAFVGLLAGCLVLLRPTRQSVALGCGLLILPHFLPWSPAGPPGCRLLAIGHGQACVLQAADGHLTAVDCGSLHLPFAAAERLVRSLPCRRLDLLVVTHADHDHHNGVAVLLQKLPIAAAVVPQALAESDLVRQLAAAGTTVRVLQPGERCEPAPHLRVQAPPLPAAAGDNDQSLWVSATLGPLRILLTGDAQELGTAAALAAGIATPHDVLVLPHHGRANANGPRLLERVAPRACLASAARADGDTVLGRIARRFGAELFVTGRDGDLWIDATRSTVQASVAGRPLPPR